MVNVSATLVSNSTQLDNVDLMGGARVFTITGVTVTEGAEQPMSVWLAEYDRPWKPGLTMRRLLAGLYGEESDEYIGKKVRLYRDEKVSFGGKKTGGTRVSHASGITKAVTLTLPISKGKFDEFKVQPLKDEPATPPAPSDPTAPAVDAFGRGGIGQPQLEAHVGKARAEWIAEDVQTLNDLFQDLQSGAQSKDEVFFGAPQQPALDEQEQA